MGMLSQKYKDWMFIQGNKENPTVKAEKSTIDVLHEIRAELTKAYVDPYNRNAFRYTTVSLLDVLDLIDKHLKDFNA